MTGPAPYTSVIGLLQAWARDTLGQTIVRPDTNGLPPTNLPANLPLHVATRIGGVDTIPVDRATVVLDTYAGDAESAEALAEQLRIALRFQLPGYITPDGRAWVKGVDTVVAPQPAAYDSTRIGRCTATYSIGVRTKHN